MDGELLTTKQAAALLKVNERTIRRWRGKCLPFVRIGLGTGKNKTIRYRVEDLRRIAEESAAESIAGQT